MDSFKDSIIKLAQIKVMMIDYLISPCINISTSFSNHKLKIYKTSSTKWVIYQIIFMVSRIFKPVPPIQVELHNPHPMKLLSLIPKILKIINERYK